MTKAEARRQARALRAELDMRQAGRAICENVICCEGDAAAIEAAIRKALSPAFAAKAHSARSPYNGGDTSGKIVRILAEFDFGRPKAFYDAISTER